MPSFPAERTHDVDTSTLLRAVAARYDEALGAVLQGQFERIDLLLDDVDRLLKALPPGHRTTDESNLYVEALERHGALISAMQSAKGTLSDEIGRMRKGRTMVHGYRAHTDDDRGLRIDADA